MIHFPHGLAIAALLSLVVSGGIVFGQPAGKMSLEELRQKRKELVQRKRRIIMNNDGCDVLYSPKSEKVTIENFLAKRTTPLAGSQVDTIAYCSISSGFSHFTHNTKVGTVLTRQGADYGVVPSKRNITQDLIDLGTDCLQAVTDFGHKNGMEVFWSMRMNDTHDVAHRPDKPYLLFPPFKVEHPDWLVGDPVKRTPHGRWSSVDYARPEIRDLAFRYIEEVCHDYDVDGVELDYFRHLCYFKSTAFGGVASEEERAMMTDLMRRARKMTEEVGMQRGRPILVSVRVPDSVGFCRDMGFDIETWMREGLFDMLITTCYFRLNPWEYSVELGHKYGVQVYPCLSDSRVTGESRFRRKSAASYRGRAMNAWAAGADGLHLFNYFNPKAPMWKELGDPQALLAMDKLYFVNVRDGISRRFLAKGPEYRTVPIFGPSHPKPIAANRPLVLPITIGDDIPAAQAAGHNPEIKLHVQAPGIQKAKQLLVKLNGTELTEGVVSKGWVDYPVPLPLAKRGKNEVEITPGPAVLDPGEWSVVYDADKKPKPPWHRDRGSKRTHDEIVDGALFIADQGKESGDYLYYRFPWGADPESEAVVEARAKVKSGSSFIIFTNGVTGERLGLWPDRIQLFHRSDLKYKMDTTSDFHVYRIEMKGQDLKVYVDGELRIDASGTLKPRSYYTRNAVAFGAANSGMVGEAYWDSVKARAMGLACYDLVVSVSYGKK